MGAWTMIEVNEDEMREYLIPVKGDLVRPLRGTFDDDGNRVDEEAIGIVVGHARSNYAHRQFTENKERARAAGRELTADDHEVLIDNEGPVVLWPNGKEDWFPGQSMGCIVLVKALPTWTQELARINAAERDNR